VTVAMGTLSIRYSERIVTRFGPRAALLAGMPLIMAALALFARAGVGGSYLVDVLPSMALLGIGAGIAFPALMAVAMSGATPADAGLASGLVNTTAQVGGALGLAVLATLSASRTSTLVHRGAGEAAALTGGYHLAFWIGAALVACAIAVVLTRLPRTAAVGASHGVEHAHGEGAAAG
jgi:MFS family permease